MKCLVKYCPNTKDQGRFEGPICSPCASILRGERSSPASATRILATIWPYPRLLDYKIGEYDGC